MKRRFFVFSFLSCIFSLAMLFVLTIHVWIPFRWMELLFHILLPVLLVSLLLHIIFLFYFWDPYERRLYRLLNLSVQTIENDIVHHFEKAWKELNQEYHKLQQELDHNRDLLNFISEGIMIIDRNGMVVFCNPVIETMLNYASIKPALRYWEIILNTQLLKDIENSLENHTGSKGEITIFSPSEKYIQYEVIPLFKTITSGVMMIKLVELTKLKKLERIRVDFVANVSHELRSPLTAILGYVETLKEERDLEKERAQKFLSVIYHNVIRLSDIVEDLLILSKVESGENLDFTSFPPAELIEEVMELYRQKIQEKHQNIHLVLKDREITMKADRYRFRQIFINLLDNAIKYTPEGGSITINQRAEDNCLIFSVEDTGIGIPYNDQERIFERFYRVDKSRTDAVSGTGLGLSIVKNIVELHQGSISIQSELGRGTCFTVSLPLN